eukprot:g22152.t1
MAPKVLGFAALGLAPVFLAPGKVSGVPRTSQPQSNAAQAPPSNSSTVGLAAGSTAILSLAVARKGKATKLTRKRFGLMFHEDGFRNLRAAEIKHGRVAMMAALGASVQHYAQFPGFEEVPTGIGAVTTAPGTYGFAALVLVSGVLELALWTEDSIFKL